MKRFLLSLAALALSVSAASAQIGGSTGSVDNQILRADGTGGSTAQASSLTITDLSTATMNNIAVKVVDGSQTNIALVFQPKGSGALISGPVPDGGNTGGNARGSYAIDLQLSRLAANQVASGSDAIAIGNNNRASGISTIALGKTSAATGDYAIAAGSGATASGDSSVMIGAGGTASGIGATGLGNLASPLGDYSTAVGLGAIVRGSDSAGAGVAIGSQADCTKPGGVALGANTRTRLASQLAYPAGAGASPHLRNYTTLLAAYTTNATVTQAGTLDGSYFTIPTNTVVAFNATVVASRTDGSTVCHYQRRGQVRNLDGVVSLVSTVQTVGTDYEGLAGCNVTITADTANSALKFNVTGIKSQNWLWSIKVDHEEIDLN